jgi:hypothetical protein
MIDAKDRQLLAVHRCCFLPLAVARFTNGMASLAAGRLTRRAILSALESRRWRHGARRDVFAFAPESPSTRMNLIFRFFSPRGDSIYQMAWPVYLPRGSTGESIRALPSRSETFNFEIWSLR